jgi:glucose/mannose-6-phosphate isomerase
LVNSNLYSDKIKKRYPLTHDVIDKNNVKTFEFTPESNQKLSQVFETLIFGSYSSYYLTKIYGIDPMEIPWVDYFKLQLAK